MEFAPGIHRINAPFGPRVNSAYLLTGDTASMLVDTGTDETARENIQPYLYQVDPDPNQVRYVVNTHSDWDHSAGNAAAREIAPSSLLCCHELDRAMIEDIDLMISDRYSEFQRPHGIGESEESLEAIRAGTRTSPVDISLQGGETFRLGSTRSVAVIHTPGHTRGSICIYDSASRTLVLGDAVLGTAVPNADGTPAFPPTYRFVEEYEATISLLLSLAPGIVATSHYGLFEGAAAEEFFKKSAAYVQRVDAELRSELKRLKSATLRELIDSLADRLGDWPAEANAALAYPLSGHLERLERAGSIQMVETPGAVSIRSTT